MKSDVFDAYRYCLRNTTAPASVLGEAGSGELQSCDLTIADGAIETIAPAGAANHTELPSHDCDGGLVLPAFVDIHTHLDKGHMWPRTPNPDGSWMSALEAVRGDHALDLPALDIGRRMEFALRCAYAHGTAAIRSHLDCVPPRDEKVWDVFEHVRVLWQSRIELQGVALIGPDQLLDPPVLHRVAMRTAASGGILGGSVADHPEARAAMFAVVDKAGELELDLDLHCDETGNPDSMALRHLADAVIETGYRGKVAAGHCCALAVQDEAVAHATIERVVEAGIAVISLPMCNMFLQDRHTGSGPRTPRWRGVTLLNELEAAGAKVALASDNTRDPFYAYGDLDALEVLREGARILHFDFPQARAFAWAKAVSSAPAASGGFDYSARIETGAPADLLLFPARNWTELMARPQSDRIVLRRGRVIDRTLPDYRELDDLMGEP